MRPFLAILLLLVVTSCQQSVPDMLCKQAWKLDGFDISTALEKKLGKEIDRVTLYRILNTYVEKGILHRIVDLNGTANYAICSSACSANQHHDEHVHFNCTNCNKVFCLATKVPEISITAGFKVETINLIAYGICNECGNT